MIVTRMMKLYLVGTPSDGEDEWDSEYVWARSPATAVKLWQNSRPSVRPSAVYEVIITPPAVEQIGLEVRRVNED